MTHPVARRLAVPLAAAALLAAAACSEVAPVPTVQNIAGLSPTGRVRLTESFVAGAGYGTGTLEFQGQSHPFRLFGTIVGGFAAQRIEATGNVYKLARLSDFAGAYSQGAGPAGVDTAKTGDLWLENKAGVIMHLTDTQSGGSLSLGRDEIYIRMSE